MKKDKWINYLIWGGLGVLILVVVITSIVLHSKKGQLEDLKDKNEIVSPEETVKFEENKIFSKNFAIFIDNNYFF